MKLTTKLYAVSGILVAVAVAIGAIGIVGIQKTNAGLDTVYNDRVVPLKQLKAIADDYAVAIIDAANKANAGLFTAEETRKGLETASSAIKKNWKDYTATSLTTEESKLAAEANKLFGPADAAVERFALYLAGKTGSLKGQLGDFDGPLYQHIDPISAKITELVDLQLRVAREEYDAAHSRFIFVLTLCTITLFVGVTIGGGLSWKVVRSTTSVLKDVAQSLTDGAAQTASAAREVSGASHFLAEGSSEQAASLEETSASLEEISSMTKRNSENAGNAAGLGRQTRASATTGLERIAELGATLSAIRGAVGEMQKAVGEMQSSSQEVAKIIRTIDEIAFQTNLLALNAAVEAARAGEAGMGFAVVADEVRALAQRSAQAAKDTSDRIEAAVKRSELGGEASTKVVKSLTEVESTAQSIQQVFSGIVGQISSLDEIIAEIAAASTEQSQGVGEVNMAVGQMDKVTQSTAAAAQENAAAASEMNNQVITLQGVVAQLESVLAGTPNAVAPSSSGPVPSEAEETHRRASTTKATIARRPQATAAARSVRSTPSRSELPMPELAGSAKGNGSFTDF